MDEFITCLLQLGTKGLWLTVTQRQRPDFKFPRRRHATVRLPSSSGDKEKRSEVVMKSHNGATVGWKEAHSLQGGWQKSYRIERRVLPGGHKSLKNHREEMVEDVAARSREVTWAMRGSQSSHTGRWQVSQGTQLLLG